MGNGLIIEKLKSEWLSIQSPSTSNASLLMFDEIVAAYTGQGRFYHGVEHLLSMISLLRQADVQQPAAYWATFYHDYVYVPGSKLNEYLSAGFAAERMCAISVDPDVIEQTVSLIEATASHTPMAHNWMNYFLDADMAILGSDLGTYQQYVRNVRLEYQAIPLDLFNAGRKHFLLAAIGANRIFTTDWFFERFEQQAISNLNWEIDQIKP